MYKLNFYVPEDAKESVKESLFSLGVGRYNNYDCCSFETLGMGQFKALNNANPTIGSLYKLEKVQEYKIEMICEAKLIKEAIKALKKVHPYEEVAYEVFKMEKF